MNPFIKFAIGGSIVGSALVAWISPAVISWWFTPPVDMLVTCKTAVEWGINTYRDTITAGAISGAILGLVALILLRAKAKPTGPVVTKP